MFKEVHISPWLFAEFEAVAKAAKLNVYEAVIIAFTDFINKYKKGE